jgi:O-antigen/teichoic acid export membrane protein
VTSSTNPEPGAVPAPPSKAAPGELRRLALRGSLYEMAGYGASQVVRLGSNLLLTRILFPEAFGLIALVNIFNTGLVMLSDVGLEPAVIQSARGDDARFLNTAWTIQIVRGFILYGVAAVCAYPLALFFHEPSLFGLTLAGSLAAILAGFNSTSLYTLRRHLGAGRINLIEFGAQCAAVVVMIPCAYWWRSPWALIAGILASSLCKTVASHVVDVGYRNKLAWDPEARAAITTFGKWIVAASAVFFISRQGDRILLGRYLGVTELGVYSIGVMLSEAISTPITRVTHGILYPVLSRVYREDTGRLGTAYYRSRLGLDVLSQPVLGLLAILGPFVVRSLYDSRYAAAGWILSAFAVRVAMMCVQTPCETCLFTIGQTRYALYQNIARMLWIMVGVPVGWHFDGLRGLVWAVALSEVPIFFVLWPALYRAGLLRFGRELRALPLFAAGAGVGLLATRLFGI